MVKVLYTYLRDCKHGKGNCKHIIGIVNMVKGLYTYQRDCIHIKGSVYIFKGL